MASADATSAVFGTGAAWTAATGAGVRAAAVPAHESSRAVARIVRRIENSPLLRTGECRDGRRMGSWNDQPPALAQIDLEADGIGQVANHGVDRAEPSGRGGQRRGAGAIDDQLGEQAGAGVAAGARQGLRELAGEVGRDVAQLPGDGVEDVGFEGVKRVMATTPRAALRPVRPACRT